MVIFLQYTFTDLRSFTEHDKMLLPKPAWPSPIPLKEFFRGGGQIIQRSKLGLNSWIGEDRICKIRRAINFSSVLHDGIEIKNVGKHFYASEGRVLSKYEFVFTAKQVHPNKKSLYLDDVIASLFSSEVRVRDGDIQRLPTNRLGEELKNHYIRNTTRKEKRKDVDTLDVISCVPQMYVHLDSDEDVNWKGIKFNKVEGGKSDFTFSLRGGWYHIQNDPVRVWLHEKRTAVSLVELNRALRISILRLHSEYSCINNVLNAIYNQVLKLEPFTEDSDRLQRYLSIAQGIISKENRYLDQRLSNNNNFLNYFQEKFDELQPGEAVSLKQRIDSFNIRPQTKEQIYQFIDNINVMNTNINNSQGIAVGEHAKVEGNTFNQVNSTLPENLDYEVLIAELSKLKAHLKTTADTPEEYKALSSVANAEAEANKKDGNKVVEYLKQGGKWVLESATKIGVSVVSKLIENNIPG